MDHNYSCGGSSFLERYLCQVDVVLSFNVLHESRTALNFSPAPRKIALITFWMCVCLPLMSRTRGRITESSSASVALVRLSAGVDVAVGLQTRELCESFATNETNVWLFSGVQLLMAFEIALTLEGLIARFAKILGRHDRDFR